MTVLTEEMNMLIVISVSVGIASVARLIFRFAVAVFYDMYKMVFFEKRECTEYS